MNEIRKRICPPNCIFEVLETISAKHAMQQIVPDVSAHAIQKMSKIVIMQQIS
jgi:hypothetical protein